MKTLRILPVLALLATTGCPSGGMYPVEATSAAVPELGDWDDELAYDSLDEDLAIPAQPAPAPGALGERNDLLADQLQTLQAQYSALQQELARSEAQVAELRRQGTVVDDGQLSALLTENEQLRSRLGALRASLFEREQRIDSLEDLVVRLQHQGQDDQRIRRELSLTRAQLSEAISAAQAVRMELDRAEREIAQLSDRLRAQRAAASQLQDQVRTLRAENEQLRDQLQRARGRVQALRDQAEQYEQLQAEIERLQAKLARARAEIEAGTATVVQVERLQRRIDTLQAQLETARSTTASQAEELERLTRKLAQQRDSSAEQARTIQQLQQQLAQARAELQASSADQATVRRLQRRVDELQGQLTQAQATSAEQAATIRQLRERIRSLETRLAAAEASGSQSAQQAQQIEQLQQQIEQLQDTRRRQQARIETQQERIAQLEAENAALEAEVARLKERVSAGRVASRP